MRLYQHEKAEAFKAAVEQFPQVTDAKIATYEDDTKAVFLTMDGHKSAVPMQIRDLAEPMDLVPPDTSAASVTDWERFELHSDGEYGTDDFETWTVMKFVPSDRQHKTPLPNSDTGR